MHHILILKRNLQVIEAEINGYTFHNHQDMFMDSESWEKVKTKLESLLKESTGTNTEFAISKTVSNLE